MTSNTNTKKIYRVFFLFLWLFVVHVSAAPLIHWTDTVPTTSDGTAQKTSLPNGLYNLPRSLWNEKNLVGPFLAAETLRPLISEQNESLWEGTLEKISLGGLGLSEVAVSHQKDRKEVDILSSERQDPLPIMEANLWPLFGAALALFIVASLRVSAQKQGC